MYPWVTHTWNPIKGECVHQCPYCYMSIPKLKPGPLRLDEKALKDTLGTGRTIFVGSSTDIFARGIPILWKWLVIDQCNKYPGNTYVLQTKNPREMYESEQWRHHPYPLKTLFGCTIETTSYDQALFYGNDRQPPSPRTRYEYMRFAWGRKFISMEPIMDFNLGEYVQWMKDIKPEFVSIGANSRRDVKLPEPPPEKIRELIKELSAFTEVRKKKNLERLTK